jgi:glucose 1-dehydrogenase
MKDSMKAGIVTPGKRGSTSLIDMPMPQPSGGEVLVRVLEVGIDGTDTEINEGKYGEPPKGEEILILGHECLGEIIEEGNSGFNKGQLVVPIVRRPDDCPDCHAGHYDLCTEGNFKEHGIRGLHGFMREYFTERPEFLVPVPGKIRGIAVLTEPLSVVEKGVSRAIALHEHSARAIHMALVLGAGSLGLLAIACFRQQNINTYGFDIVSESSLKARISEALAAHYVDGRTMDLEQLPGQIGKPDIIFEATGNSLVMFQAMLILENNGVLCIAGLPSGAKPLPVESDALLSGLVLGNKTIFGTVSSNRSHYEKAVQLLIEAEDRWPGLMSRIVTGRFRLENFVDALHPEDVTIKNIVQVDST